MGSVRSGGSEDAAGEAGQLGPVFHDEPGDWPDTKQWQKKQFDRQPKAQPQMLIDKGQISQRRLLLIFIPLTTAFRISVAIRRKKRGAIKSRT